MPIEHFNLTKKLHTDVLEEKYGPVHSEVLRHDEKIREVHIEDAQGISRTYAITFFTFDRANKELVEIDEKIKNGGLIGKTFREHGYEIRKNVISVFLVPISPELREKMRTEESQAKARLSEFYAKKEGSEPVIYGVVSEIYSPDFRPPEINEVDKEQDNPATSAMEEVGIAKSEIWERIGRNNDFSGLEEKLERAKELAHDEEEFFKRRVEEYIAQKH
jgi:hypothetical protein